MAGGLQPFNLDFLTLPLDVLPIQLLYDIDLASHFVTLLFLRLAHLFIHPNRGPAFVARSRVQSSAPGSWEFGQPLGWMKLFWGLLKLLLLLFVKRNLAQHHRLVYALHHGFVHP